MAPLCVKSGAAKPFCQILSQKEQTLPLAGCSPWVFVNGSAAGYYRTQYDKADLQKLIAMAGTDLTTAERISLLRDQAALVGSGQESMATYLDLISAMNQDAQREIVESYLPTLDYVNSYLLDADGCGTVSLMGALELRANDGENWLDACAQGKTPTSTHCAAI